MANNKLILIVIIILAAAIAIGGYLYLNKKEPSDFKSAPTANNIEGVDSDLDAALNSIASPDALQDELKEQDLNFDVSF
ncbi:MAG: hypothetical protein AAB607_02095 [Patescibacteria group bacterium]